jgi:hypothetical protein
MDILLYEILEHMFHFIKMEINQILNLLKRPTVCVIRMNLPGTWHRRILEEIPPQGR